LNQPTNRPTDQPTDQPPGGVSANVDVGVEEMLDLLDKLSNTPVSKGERRYYDALYVSPAQRLADRVVEKRRTMLRGSSC
jgi:hypothetical protein